ncbi:hypothetical protein [Brevibacillus dissolubilis]|uniref:hypothetical protein n=1 Tax=Brevibacillus dissolubilis TaxID=1844116 RepID=UPI0011160F1F|nr:hypothetical protein [Brevibacillus dissolubilis]
MKTETKYMYGLIATAGLFLLFQVFGQIIWGMSGHERGGWLLDVATVMFAFFILLQGIWLYQDKRDWIATVYLVLCVAGFVYLMMWIW